MSLSTTELLSFYSIAGTFEHRRIEIRSPLFDHLANSLRALCRGLSDTEDPISSDLLLSMRKKLFELLTVPVTFDDSVPKLLMRFNQSHDIESRWGENIAQHHKEAFLAARELTNLHNPLRSKLAEVLKELCEHQKRVCVYCSKCDKPLFESLFSREESELLDELIFVHSVAQYRKLTLCDTLVKVGPLRANGWGSCPDAVISAPRFETLAQLVWHRSQDEEDFGYDPIVSAFPNAKGKHLASHLAKNSSCFLSVKWQIHRTEFSDTTVGRAVVTNGDDDFELLSGFRHRQNYEDASLVQVSNDKGMLFPVRSRVLVFDLKSSVAEYQRPGDVLPFEMLLVRADLTDYTTSETSVQDGQYSSFWKQQLKDEYRCNPRSLLTNLAENGLRLRNLRSAIERWCEESSTVIHAPKTVEHFRILITTLGIDFENSYDHDNSQASWWQYAWNEVRKSRGEAIHSGFEEQHLIEQEQMRVLLDLAPRIEDQAERRQFSFGIPAGYRISGALKFHTILSVEGGFSAPQDVLRQTLNLERIKRWRV